MGALDARGRRGACGAELDRFDLGFEAVNLRELVLDRLFAALGATEALDDRGGEVVGADLLLVTGSRVRLQVGDRLSDRVRSFRRGQGATELDLHAGSRLPAYCTALGKLLLASLPETEQRDLITSIKPAKRGPNTITAKKVLSEELDHIGDAGFAVNDEELAADLFGIAVPVRDAGAEVVAAVGLSAHSSMISLEEMVDALSPHLFSAADRISARLGYRRADEQS